MEEPNLDYIKEMTSGDSVFGIKIITILKEELPVEVMWYKEKLALNNFNEAAAAVHKLKHKISILGLESAYELANIHEEELKNSKTNNAIIFSNILDKMLKFVAELQ